MKLENIVVVITGGASGLGAATAKTLSNFGAKIAILDNNYQAAENNNIIIKCDVTDTNQVQNALDKIQKSLGDIRACVNCAGIVHAKRIVGKKEILPLEDFAKVINVNLIGTFNVLRLVAAKMSKLTPVSELGERGVIINTASIAAFEGQLGQIAYSASKGGVASMTLPAARELANFGIRVNTIAPGIFATPMMLGLTEEIQNNLIKNVLFPKQLGDPNEYAKLVKHIIENTMLNGNTIRLDAGLRLQ